jgi:hypothetical protein
MPKSRMIKLNPYKPPFSRSLGHSIAQLTNIAASHYEYELDK